MSREFGCVPLPTSPSQGNFEEKFRSQSITSMLSQTSQDNPERILSELTEKRSMDNTSSTDELLEIENSHKSLIPIVEPPPPPPLEHRVPFSTKLIYLALYFILNLGLTLSNKGLMQMMRAPWLLTVMHSTSTAIGCSIFAATGRLKLSKIGTKEQLIILGFSSLFTLNIAVSNVSLSMVSVPFHQIARSTCPIVTALINRTVFNRSYERQTYLSMMPLTVGVAMATIGDYYVSIVGAIFTILGVFLASIKTVTTNRLMTGPLSLSSMELLLRVSPLAALQCLFYAIVSGEFQEVRRVVQDGQLGFAFATMLLANALGAFFLNTVSFQTNKLAGALTMSVCGNVKQCMTIVLGIVLFHVDVRAFNGLGMIIALGGAAWYSKVELQSRKASR